jgi:hypothetical protein
MLSAAEFTSLAPAIEPGPIATASGGGTTVTASALRGQAAITQSCGEGCLPTSLQTFRSDLANMTVAGTQITQRWCSDRLVVAAGVDAAHPVWQISTCGCVMHPAC